MKISPSGTARRVESVDDGRKHQVRARQARDVVDHDGDALAGAHDLAEGGGPDRVFQRFHYSARLIADGIGLAGHQPVPRDLDLQVGLAVERIALGGGAHGVVQR